MKIKLNNLFKATSKVAFLFGILVLASPGLCSQNSYEVTSENSPCEVVCSSSLTKATATRSYKNANRQIENITCDNLTIDTTNKLINLKYPLIDIYTYDGNVGEYYFNIYFNVNYNYDTSTLNEAGSFEVYYYNDNSDFELVKNYAWQVDDFTNETQFSFTFGVTSNFIDNTPLLVSLPYFTLGYPFADLDQNEAYLPIGTQQYFGGLPFSTVLTDIAILENTIINNAQMGIFETATIEYGIYNIVVDDFEGYVNNSIDKIPGGYIANDWDGAENYYSQASNTADLIFANVASFGIGKDITPYKYLFPMTYDVSNVFSFGQQLSVYFNNGFVWSITGADVEYGLSAFDTNEMIKLSGSTIVTKIVFSGNNADYIPYGLSTSNDYTAGYDKGYQNGYENGNNYGYHLGLEEGKNDINDQKYQEGYNKGYEDATERYSDGSLSLNGVLNAIVTAPSKIIKEGLDFELLGFNIGSLVMSLIVIGLVVWSIGFFKKG